MSLSVSRQDWLYLLLISIGLIALKGWVTQAAGLEMHFDESQYWTWSQQLDWSYATKGPLVAWLIALSEYFFGHGAWQTRLPGWIAASLFLIFLHLFARDVWGSREAGWWALVLGLFTPLYGLLGLVMSTDVFIFLFWSWGLWAAFRVLTQGQRYAWYELGLACGLGVLAKVSIGLLPTAVGLLVLIQPGYRRHLKDPHLWGGLLLFFACTSPVLYWNTAHDWVMLRHNVGHVAHDVWSLRRVGEFFLGQWLALSPLVVLVALSVLWRKPKAEDARLIWIISLGCLIFFMFKAFSATILVNWAGAVYIGFLVLFAGRIKGLSRWMRRVFTSGLLLNLLLFALVLFPASFGLPEQKSILKKLRAWEEPVAQLAESAGAVDFLLVPNYRLASELHYYWPTKTRVYLSEGIRRRFNQYDIWPGSEREEGRTGLYVWTSSVTPSWVFKKFARCEAMPTVEALTSSGALMRTLYAYRCEGYRPTARSKPKQY